MDLDLTQLLPIPPPLPRRVIVEEYRHPEACACRCWREGFAAGQRAERERADRELIGLSALVPTLAAMVLGLATALAWRWWAG